VSLTGQIAQGVGQKSPVQGRMHAENLVQDQARRSEFGGERAGAKVAVVIATASPS